MQATRSNRGCQHSVRHRPRISQRKSHGCRPWSAPRASARHACGRKTTQVEEYYILQLGGINLSMQENFKLACLIYCVQQKLHTLCLWKRGQGVIYESPCFKELGALWDGVESWGRLPPPFLRHNLFLA